MEDSNANLDQLLPGLRGQVVRVKVVDKQPRQESPNGCTYQRMIFIDEQGNRKTATLFGVDCSVYETIIQRGRWYNIKNLVVRLVPSRYAAYDWELLLYFTNSTEVATLTEGSTPNIVRDPLTLINNIPRNASKDDRFDVMVVLLHVHPEKIVVRDDTSMPVRELSVTDYSSVQVLGISAWSRSMMLEFERLEYLLADDPVIEFKGLKISNFAGFSLVATMSTEVKIHPNSDRATALRTWRNNNEDVLELRRIHALSVDGVVYPIEITRIDEALVIELPDPHVVRVKVHIPKVSRDDLRLSLGCRACGKVCPDDSVQFNDQFPCQTCGVLKTAEAKLYLRFRCTDGTGTLSLDAYTRNVEKLLKVKSEEFYVMPLPDRQAILERAQIRYRIGTAELLIAPVKNLFTSHGVIKWYLKDVMA